MATSSFDTYKLVDRLRAAGFNDQQAEAVVRVLAESQETLVTRDYLDLKLEQGLSPIRAELLVVKWMLGVLLAGVLSLILKAFF
jgi:hypothetical protein